MRPIDADALIEFLGGMRAELDFFDDEERPRYEAYSKALYILNEYLKDAPSIDIVRCKECKYRKKNGFCLEHNRYEKNDNGYCSYGERSEE